MRWRCVYKLSLVDAAINVFVYDIFVLIVVINIVPVFVTYVLVDGIAVVAVMIVVLVLVVILSGGWIVLGVCKYVYNYLSLL